MLVKALEREREVIFDNGKKEGIDMGKKEGITERNRQLVHTMVANGFSLPTIATLLALPLPEIEALLAEPDTKTDKADGQTAGV